MVRFGLAGLAKGGQPIQGFDENGEPCVRAEATP